MRNVIKPSIVLFLFATIAGLCLGFVFDVTQEPIHQQELQAKATAMKQIFPVAVDFQDRDLNENATVDSLTECFDAAGHSIGFVIGASEAGYSGLIEVLVAINHDAVIEGISVVKQSETPGLGSNAALPKFTDQYIGKTGVLSVTKSGSPTDSEVQAITSSTITTRAVTTAVNDAFLFFTSELGGES